jgi:urease accessory protein UreH
LKTDRPLDAEAAFGRARPAGEVGRGRLRIAAALQAGRTVLTAVERTAPFALGPPSYRAGPGTAEVIVQQVGPGIFPGDDLLVELTVRTGARLVVRGQGATRLYPCPEGTSARLRTEIRVESGGELVLLPGEVIPFRDAELRQETVAEVSAGGRLILTEIVTPGRLAMGERDVYRRLDLRLRLVVDGRPALVERARLEPRLRPLNQPGRHGPFAVAGALYVVGGVPFPLAGLTSPDGCLLGAGNTGDVAIARLLAPTAQIARETFQAAIERMRAASVGDRAGAAPS